MVPERYQQLSYKRHYNMVYPTQLLAPPWYKYKEAKYKFIKEWNETPFLKKPELTGMKENWKHSLNHTLSELKKIREHLWMLFSNKIILIIHTLVHTCYKKFANCSISMLISSCTNEIF